jgi:hypothetical protein
MARLKLSRLGTVVSPALAAAQKLVMRRARTAASAQTFWLSFERISQCKRDSGVYGCHFGLFEVSGVRFLVGA